MSEAFEHLVCIAGTFKLPEKEDFCLKLNSQINIRKFREVGENLLKNSRCYCDRYSISRQWFRTRTRNCLKNSPPSLSKKVRGKNNFLPFPSLSYRGPVSKDGVSPWLRCHSPSSSKAFVQPHKFLLNIQVPGEKTVTILWQSKRPNYDSTLSS